MFFGSRMRTQKVEYLNRVYEEMWGDPREALMRDLTIGRIVHPEDRAKLKALPGLLAGEVVTIHIGSFARTTARSLDSRHRFSDSERSGRSRSGGRRGPGRHGRRTREEALRRSQERFRLLVEGARDYAMFLARAGDRHHFLEKEPSDFWMETGPSHRTTGHLIFTPEDRAKGCGKRNRDRPGRGTRVGSPLPPAQRWLALLGGRRLMRLDEETGELRGFAKVARDASDQRAIEEDRGRRATRWSGAWGRNQGPNRDESGTRADDEHARNWRKSCSKSASARSAASAKTCTTWSARNSRDGAFPEIKRDKAWPRKSCRGRDLEESAQTVNPNVGLARDLARGLQPVELNAAGLKEAPALAELPFERPASIAISKRPGAPACTEEPSPQSIPHRAGSRRQCDQALGANGTHDFARPRSRASLRDCWRHRQRMSAPAAHQGLGLHIMRYRANALGGDSPPLG